MAGARGLASLVTLLDDALKLLGFVLAEDGLKGHGVLILLQTLTYEDTGPRFCVKCRWWLVQTVILCHSIILTQ